MSKESPKNKVVAHLSNKFEKSSLPTKAVGHVPHNGKEGAFNASDTISHFASSNDNKAPKSAWKVKKKRHDEGLAQKLPTALISNVKSTEPKPIPQGKEATRDPKQPNSSIQTSSGTHKPLQENSKQNIVTVQPEKINTMKGFKTAMHIEQVSNNHFKFTEENRPPKVPIEVMECSEDDKGKANSSTEVQIQDEAEMGQEQTSTSLQTI